MKVRPAGTKRLNADMLGANFSEVVRISEVRLEECGAQRKPCMYFEGHEKSLVLNATNIDTLTALFGTDESDLWIGRRIDLFTTYVTFQGRQRLGIRVRPPTTTTGSPQPRRTDAADLSREPSTPTSPMTASDMRW